MLHRDLPALREALEDWRDLAADPHAADALLRFDEAAQHHQQSRDRLAQLQHEPPQFDANDLSALLDGLASAQRFRSQIVQANELEILIPTLRAFLFDPDEPLADKLRDYPVRIRYMGVAILAELWGRAHPDEWPIYSPQALAGMRLLGWELPARDYLAFARAVADLRSFYEQGARVAPTLPLFVELDRFLGWVVESSRRAPAEADPAEAPTPAPRPARASQVVREFGAPYDSAPAPPHAWLDRPLTPPTAARLAEAEAVIRQALALPPTLIERAAAHLLAGRHLILTGVPGTGKSHLAALLARELFGYYPMLVTATAEWSAFDVVGGLVPAADESGTLRYAVRPGVVYEALRRNWLLTDEGEVRRDATGVPLRVGSTQEGQQWPGVWLIIDELNRADADKALGDLFTALESGQLRVPRVGPEPSMIVPLPRDFRIIATLNSRDRHFLFALSDALKRRFAFVEIAPPDDPATEVATLLRRAEQALAERGLTADTAALRQAMGLLYPAVTLIRAFQPLGSAPLLAALHYIGASQSLPPRPLEALVQEAVIAELLPQTENLHGLPLALLAALLRGDVAGALAQLEAALRHGYGDAQPLHMLAALASLSGDAALAADTEALARQSPADPATLDAALALLATLRSHADSLPAPTWPAVAQQLDQ